MVSALATFGLGCHGGRDAAASRSRAEPPAATASAGPLVAAPRAKIQHELLALALPGGTASVHHFAIPLAGVQIEYVDLNYQTPLIETLAEHDLVINGGYWGYRGRRPVIEGLLVVNGRELSAPHAQGGVLELRADRARVVRGEDFVLASNTTLALQCHPRLVDAGKVIQKLESQKHAARTALCVTRERDRLEAYLTWDAITLPALAAFLVQQGCQEALNLDGGRSTSAVARLPSGPLTIGHGQALPYGLGFKVR